MRLMNTSSVCLLRIAKPQQGREKVEKVELAGMGLERLLATKSRKEDVWGCSIDSGS